MDQLAIDFDGATYERPLDKARLTGQLLRIYAAMADGRWRTLYEIEAITGDPPQSVSARLRDLRKPRFGGHEVFRQRRDDPKSGLHEYRLEVSK